MIDLHAFAHAERKKIFVGLAWRMDTQGLAVVYEGKFLVSAPQRTADAAIRHCSRYTEHGRAWLSVVTTLMILGTKITVGAESEFATDG